MIGNTMARLKHKPSSTQLKGHVYEARKRRKRHAEVLRSIWRECRSGQILATSRFAGSRYAQDDTGGCAPRWRCAIISRSRLGCCHGQDAPALAGTVFD